MILVSPPQRPVGQVGVGWGWEWGAPCGRLHLAPGLSTWSLWSLMGSLNTVQTTVSSQFGVVSEPR